MQLTKILLLGLCLFFAAPAFPQIGCHVSDICPQNAYKAPDCIIVQSADSSEIAVYNLTDSVCTSILIVSNRTNSPMYRDLLQNLFFCRNTGSGTEIQFNQDFTTFKIFLIK